MYYNHELGIAESEHVFLFGNNLIERWSSHQDDFVIAETGFGTGLNFLTSCFHWQRINGTKSNRRLTYIAFEATPLSNEQIAYALSAFPQLASLSAQLIQQLPPLIVGSYLIQLDKNIELVLYYQPAEEIMPKLSFAANAWYLDGFAPSRNASIWSPVIYDNLARCSAYAATVATYSVANQVQQMLEERGFIISKKTGIGKKKHMLTALLSKSAASHTKRQSTSAIAIIGAGLAGSATADALQRIGVQSDTYESEQSPASRASANPSVILYFKPERLRHASQRLKWAAYVYALSYYARADLQGAMHKKNILLAARDARGKKWLAGWQSAFRQRALQGYMHMIDCSDLTHEQDPALLFPRSGSVDLPQVCARLLTHTQLHRRTKITSIEETSQGYLLTSNTGMRKEYTQLVLTVNAAIQDFADLNIRAFKGQIDYYQPLANHYTSATGSRQSAGSVDADAASIYCSSMSLNQGDTLWQAGANFQAHFNDLQPDKKVQEHHLQQLHTDFPGLHLPNEYISSWCDIRTTTPDYLPLCGLLAQHSRRTDAHIYINLGHGGKGSLMIPLAAQLLAHQIQGWSLIPEYNLLHPLRFSHGGKP